MVGFIGYQCSVCGANYSPNEAIYTCPKDGGNLDVQIDIEKIKDQYQLDDITKSSIISIWRYLPLRPNSEP